jgi:hypothetical protein
MMTMLSLTKHYSSKEKSTVVTLGWPRSAGHFLYTTKHGRSKRAAEPTEGETFQQFSTRLRKLALDSNYEADTDNHIRDALLWKCKSPYIKRRLLEEGDELTLARTLTLAAQCEKIESQMGHTHSGADGRESVNKVGTGTAGDKSRHSYKQHTEPCCEHTCEGAPRKLMKGNCYRCGKEGQ